MFNPFTMRFNLILSLILFLNPFGSFSQTLRKMTINALGNSGIQNQKVSLCYELEIIKYAKYQEEKKLRQLFMGIGFGAQNYNTYQPPTLGTNFVAHANGLHMLFSINLVSTNPKIWKPQQFKNSFLTFRIGINQFNSVKAYFNNYGNNGFVDSDDVFNPRCNSVDYEVLIGRLYKLNSYNYLKLGYTFGIRYGSVTGIRYHHGKLNPNDTRFREMLFPCIFGICVGYQFQFGKVSSLKNKRI